MDKKVVKVNEKTKNDLIILSVSKMKLLKQPSKKHKCFFGCVSDGGTPSIRKSVLRCTCGEQIELIQTRWKE